MGTAVASAGLAELTRAAGGGYHGPPELTVARAFTEWTLDPWMLALVLILGGGYLAGMRRQPGWPVARRIWFLGLGLGFLVVATMSWVGVYQSVLFYARAVQTVLTFLALMASCFAFFWTLLRVDPVPKQYSYAVSMWITGAEVIGDAFLGLAIIASQNLIGAAWYHALARPWGPTLQSDQIIGGGALWILGDLVGLPFLAAQLIQLIREDESDAARIDAELDAMQARQAAAEVPAAGEQAGERPWWEDDPRFTGRFKPT